MAETKKCPKCGAELLPSAPAGICPKCLMEAGLGSQATVDQDSGANPPLPLDEEGAETIPPGAKFPTPSSETLTRQFPQLQILEHLGQGGMGVVYKARQRRLNRLVALKILPPSVGEQPAFAERFSREAQALARLNHSNIVQVYDFGETDVFFYFIMEFVDGVNLRALIRDGKLKPEEALSIVPQICEALQFAHDEGIVHRDIKPENILIDRRGRAKIADFGLAKLLGRAPEDLSLTGTGQLMGTLGYMAPEQLQQAHAVDHRADIYSLGVVFYEMLTGQLPIGKFDPPSKKVQVDVRLDEVVLHALENEPDRRYQHASEVKTDVESIRSAPWPSAGSKAPFATATSLPPREPLGTEATQVPAPVSLNDRFYPTGLRRLVFTTTSWAIVLCVLGITGTFLVWFYLLGEPSLGTAYLQLDANNAGQFALIVGGTEGSDQISITPAGTALRVQIDGPGVQFDQSFDQSRQPVSRIEVYAQGGNDHISVDPGVTVPAFLFGGDGNNHISAGGGPSVLVGGAGNDQLTGGSANNILIGGQGIDKVEGGSAGDILIGGTTDFDANLEALEALLAEWDRTDGTTYQQKVDHLSGATTGGNNGPYFLTTSIVHDDGNPDNLVSGGGFNWYFARLTGPGKDKIKGLKTGEIVTAL
jgi:tRNA A-37 threonylcarbamoyl transferase component Bud32